MTSTASPAHSPSHPAQAVRGIHELKIVHSDLKPANFLLVQVRGVGLWVCMQCGCACSAGCGRAGVHAVRVGSTNLLLQVWACLQGR